MVASEWKWIWINKLWCCDNEISTTAERELTLGCRKHKRWNNSNCDYIYLAGLCVRAVSMCYVLGIIAKCYGQNYVCKSFDVGNWAMMTVGDGGQRGQNEQNCRKSWNIYAQAMPCHIAAQDINKSPFYKFAPDVEIFKFFFYFLMSFSCFSIVAGLVFLFAVVPPSFWCHIQLNIEHFKRWVLCSQLLSIYFVE